MDTLNVQLYNSHKFIDIRSITEYSFIIGKYFGIYISHGDIGIYCIFFSNALEMGKINPINIGIDNYLISSVMKTAGSCSNATTVDFFFSLSIYPQSYFYVSFWRFHFRPCIFELWWTLLIKLATEVIFFLFVCIIELMTAQLN